ncbi:MAG: serine/threonine protein kinase with repeat, partial [Candidatus Aminicenantes bacterium]|nr:serine/threonine protein kinase with repeat [Candidatus Aminicenantes bacterium]
MSLAVLNFENTSADSALEGWEIGIPLLLVTDLNQSKYISVLSYDQTQSTLRRSGLQVSGPLSSDDLGRVAKACRATYTATGGIMRAGERLLVVLSLKNHASGEARSSKLECAGEAGIPSLVDEMTVLIKEFMGLSRSQISGDLDALTVDITTASPEAFKLYSEGRRQHMTGNAGRAVQLMRSAIEKDPEFALAFRGLWAALEEVEGSDKASPYLEKAFSLSWKASPRERFWIHADYYDESEATYDIGLETCQNWMRLYPRDVHAMHRTGRIYLSREDHEQAVKYLRLSIREGDVNPYTHLFLALAYDSAGLYEEGRRAAQFGLRLFPENSVIEEALFDNAVSQGRIEDAQALLAKQASRRSGPAADLKAGDLLTLQGRYAEAGSVLAGQDPAKRYWLPTSSATSKYSVRWRQLLLYRAEGKLDRALSLARELGDHL